MDCVAVIAEKIHSGTPVAVYGVCSAAVAVINRLRREYGVVPAQVCDRDERKWGKALAGVKIGPVEQALEAFPALHILLPVKSISIKSSGI